MMGGPPGSTTDSTSSSLKVVRVNLGDMMATMEGNLKAHSTQLFNSTKLMMMAQEKRLTTMIKEEAAKTTGELRSNIVSTNKEMLKTWQTYLDNSLLAAMKVKQMQEMPPSNNNNNNNVNYNQGKSTLVNDLSSFKKHVDAILNTVQCQGCGGSVAFSQAYSLTKKRGRKPRSSLKLESPSPKSSSKSPRTSPKSMPVIDQTQEERLTNDLRDIMREANILEELEGEKAEQENLEALKSIEGAAEENRDVETVDEEVDVESVWSPRSLIQDLNDCQKWRSPMPSSAQRSSRMSRSSPRIPVTSSLEHQVSGMSSFSEGGLRGEKRGFALFTSGSSSSASSQTLTPSASSLARSTTPNQVEVPKPWTPSLQPFGSNSSFQGDLGDFSSKSRNRRDSFSSWSSKSPFTPVSCSRPPPTPGNDCFTPTIRPIELSTIKATSAEIAKMKQSNVSPTEKRERGTPASSGGGPQQLNMEMVRKGGLNKQALPSASEISRENVAAMLDLPDYTASNPGPGETVFHTSTSHMVHRCGLCGEDLFSAAALERHTVMAHSNKKQKI